jgi:hypothetical protein
MKLAHAFIVKDQMTKQALYDIFSDNEGIMEAIDGAFNYGMENWWQQLRAMFDEREVESLAALITPDSPDLSEMIPQLARAGVGRR